MLPLTKKDFISKMLVFTGAKSGYALPSLMEKQVIEFLKDNYGLANLDMPSIYRMNYDYLLYFGEVWTRNLSYLNVSVDNYGINHNYRKLVKGKQISSEINILLYQMELSYDWNNGWFTKLPYYERKYLMPVQDFRDYGSKVPDIQLFRISHIPEDVKFEGGDPTIGELYIAHPYRTGVYLPMTKYEHLIFRERIHEMSKIMMALGATEIRTIQNTGYGQQSSNDVFTRTSASVSYSGKFGVSGNYSINSQAYFEKENDESIIINFKNDPDKRPYVPNGLVWYPVDKEWQDIAHNRLYGNLREYEINISSKEVNLISTSERRSIEAQVNIILSAGNFLHCKSSTSFLKEETARNIRILIKFKSRNDY